MTDSARSGRRGCGRSAGRRVPAVAGDARQADPAQDQRKRSLLGVCRGGFRFHPPQACPVCRPTTSWPSYAEGRGDQQVISWIPQIYSKFGGRRERRRRDVLPQYQLESPRLLSSGSFLRPLTLHPATTPTTRAGFLCAPPPGAHNARPADCIVPACSVGSSPR